MGYLDDLAAGDEVDTTNELLAVIAAELTDNQNDPGDITDTPLVNPNADQETVEAYQEYKDNLEEKLREEHGDSITAHRFFHGGEISDLEEGSEEIVERLKNGESVQPRTLGSWTTNESLIPGVIEGVAPDAEEEDIEKAVVVEMDIPVENVMDIHSANPELDDGDQDELIAALDWSDDLSDGEVKDAIDVVQEHAE